MLAQVAGQPEELLAMRAVVSVPDVFYVCLASASQLLAQVGSISVVTPPLVMASEPNMGVKLVLQLAVDRDAAPAAVAALDVLSLLLKQMPLAGTSKIGALSPVSGAPPSCLSQFFDFFWHLKFVFG